MRKITLITEEIRQQALQRAVPTWEKDQRLAVNTFLYWVAWQEPSLLRHFFKLQPQLLELAMELDSLEEADSLLDWDQAYCPAER